MTLMPVFIALGAMGIFCLGVLVGAGMVTACVREHVALCDLSGTLDPTWNDTPEEMLS
jgi:hypothetical protein